MGLKDDIKTLKDRSDSEYKEYKRKLTIMEKEYNDRCSEFDVLIGTINAERLSFRKEIRELYKFLQTIGGSLREEKKITVFDFADEAPAPNQMYGEIPALSEPNYKDSDAWEFIYKGVIGLAIDHNKNKKLYQKFLLDVENRSMEYEKDISERTTQISYMKDAIEIAKIYRNIIVTVRDTIAEKIIPELDLIQAFLYADAIKEMVLDGVEPTCVEPCGISEYRDTKQDIHYQFVKNTFDFYKISTAFFKKTVLSDILADKIVSEEEKMEFRKEVNSINSQVKMIAEKKVI